MLVKEKVIYDGKIYEFRGYSGFHQEWAWIIEVGAEFGGFQVESHLLKWVVE